MRMHTRRAPGTVLGRPLRARLVKRRRTGRAVGCPCQERQPSTGELGKLAFASLFSDRPLVLPPFYGAGHKVAGKAIAHQTSAVGTNRIAPPLCCPLVRALLLTRPTQPARSGVAQL